jgi:integrase
MRQEFSIVARYGKNGMTYYVRYFINNMMIPSQWSTKTNDPEKAAVFSRKNKEMILQKYFRRKEGKTLYTILEKYYKKDSTYLKIDAVRGRKLSESSRKILHGFILNTFIPFLKNHNIKDFPEITVVLINRFQNYLLLDKKLLPQSINRQVSGIKSIFNHLYMTGVVSSNAIKDTVPLRRLNSRIRGCYALDELAGIFKHPWKDYKSYLLCALIYSTGMRNNEISGLRVKDIIEKDTLDYGPIFFLNIERSKTVNGIRKIPLHHKVKDALDLWISERRLSDDTLLFINYEDQPFYRYTKRANLALGSLLGREPDALDEQNISFYSGRHFYKTMLNTYNLGDVEELFMGHSVNKKVSELYNHKDKRGEQELLRAAKAAIDIIDKCLFQ